MSVIDTSVNKAAMLADEMFASIGLNDLFRGRNRRLAIQVIHLVNDLSDYWPLTVRQIYYQCVARLLVKNLQSEYQRISKMLAKLRRNDLLDWQAIEDRTRRTTDKRGVEDLAAFIREQTMYFLDPKYYHRCRVQEQDVYIEAATEKDALSAIMEEAVWPYCCRLNVCKGQVSATMIEQMSKRFTQASDNGQEPFLLYFGDLDPSGVAIPKAIQRNLWEHHNVFVELKRIALNKEQIDLYNLPQSVDAAKASDPNYEKWIAEYSDTPPTELDALHPADLKRLVESSIQKHLDMDSFLEQMEIEKEERLKLKRMRQKILGYAANEYPGFFQEGAA